MELDNIFKDLYKDGLESRRVFECLSKPIESWQSLTDPHITQQQFLKNVMEATGKLLIISGKAS
jgi:hypothetical protein